MDPIELDELRNKSGAELTAQLEKLKAELKKLKEERSLPGADVTDGAPNKLSEMEKLRPFLVEVSKKQRAALREAYKNRECVPLNLRNLRLNYQEDPCCTAASPPAFSEDGEGKEA